jgi:hypothetical protein
MAWRISRVGQVTVSLRRSMKSILTSAVSRKSIVLLLHARLLPRRLP